MLALFAPRVRHIILKKVTSGKYHPTFTSVRLIIFFPAPLAVYLAVYGALDGH